MEWKTVIQNDYYEVNEYCQVRNKKRPNKILSTQVNNSGYLKVVLYRNGKQETYYVHRLGATAFLPNDDPEYKTQINHIDENKLNNHISNLEWVTPKENINYGTANARRATALDKPVEQYDLQGNLIAIYPSGIEAALQTGIDNTGICYVCKGKRKTAGGYKWRYKQEKEDVE